MLTIKRVYEQADEEDGFRVLVDRLWPRGVSKLKAKLDLWLKEIAPSSELRIWFSHDPAKWAEFEKRYRAELQHNPDAVKTLLQAMREHKKVTLLFGAKDTDHNEAVVLKKYLAKK